MKTPKKTFQHEDEFYSSNIMTEYRQCIEEGLAVESYKDLFTAVSRMPLDENRERMADVLFDIVSNAPTADGYGYDEPSTPDGIKWCRDATVPKKVSPDMNTLEDKIRGAWYGRISGCFLGKPVEGIRTDEFNAVLKETGNFPMTRYIRRSELSDELIGRMKFNLDKDQYCDVIKCAPADDDTNYTVLYQELISKCGRNFTPDDVADMWVNKQSKYAYFTAERTAFINFINGFAPPASASYKNPFREWIGAQIRADYFGYINPGDPETAADMAFRDASVSHTKNGIYGEMFVAALIAVAAVEKDIGTAIRTALKVVPQKSRFVRFVSEILEAFENGISEDECFALIHKNWNEFEGHDWCHTLSNIQIVVASLLYGGGDFSKSICRAVQTGFDTDCNGATVGSVLGMMNGYGAIGDEWTSRFNGRLDTQIFGVGTVNIEDRVKTTMEHIAL